MFANYLKIALRNLTRHKMFSLINIGGLMIGIGACIIILLYVSFELSYDRFHERGDQIYRMKIDGFQEGEPVSWRAKVYGWVGPMLEEKYPEVIASARILNLHGIMGTFVLSYEDAKFSEEKIYYADGALLDIFSFKMIASESIDPLARPNTVVVTESIARKYFGDEPALGKSLIMNGTDAYIVTGIVQDVPENSHLKFDFLFSIKTLESQTFMLGWADFLTYILLAPNADARQLDAKLIAKDIVAERYSRSSTDGTRTQISLQALHDIHLYSHLEGEVEANGSAATTYGLLIVAFFILIIAWINYVNLSTARALDRAKEVGVRKVVGAQRNNLIGQFLLESAILNFIAAVGALLLVINLLPFFNDITGKQLALSMYGRFDLWAILLAVFLSGGLLSGLYPALVLSGFRPIKVLKGVAEAGRRRLTLRKALVVYQFAASVVLIAATWAVFQQLSFMRNQELGIDIARTVVVKAPGIADSTYSNRLSAFRIELARQAVIQSITTSSNIPGRESTWGGTVRRLADTEDQAIGVDFFGINYEFVDAYGMKLLAGRTFSAASPSDRNAALVNEAALKQLRYDAPEAILGQKIRAWRGAEFEVIGVLPSHHQLSLQYAQIPTVYFLRTSGSFFSIKFKTSDFQETLALIRSEYENQFPGNPFEYFFLDDYFNRQYLADQRFGEIFGLFAGLAIFIACLGLLALSADAARKRTKEIGIRKVLGASIPNLIALLSKDFLLLVLIANLIALPLAGLAIQKWLESYAYRITLGWAMFALPALLVIVIALLTVSAQAIRAAQGNPVEALRYE